MALYICSLLTYLLIYINNTTGKGKQITVYQCLVVVRGFEPSRNIFIFPYDLTNRSDCLHLPNKTLEYRCILKLINKLDLSIYRIGHNVSQLDWTA